MLLFAACAVLQWLLLALQQLASVLVAAACCNAVVAVCRSAADFVWALSYRTAGLTGCVACSGDYSGTQVAGWLGCVGTVVS